jgi:molybdenum cofactor biosynthesis enzyme
MVNVSSKDSTKRTATATGRIYLPPSAFQLISGSHDAALDDNPDLARAQAKARGKGDVLTVAQLAGIMASKRTADLIPLCHPLALSHVSVSLVPCPAISPPDAPEPLRSNVATMPSVQCEATVACEGKTGVEMEALTAVSVALLTVWDMVKAVAGKEMIISDIHVSHKSGGKSGDFRRDDVVDRRQ